MKKLNNILALITSLMVCTQFLSVPSFAMKSNRPKNNQKIILTCTQQDLNNKIADLATEIHNKGFSDVNSNQTIISIISNHIDHLPWSVYNKESIRYIVEVVIERAPKRATIEADIDALQLVVQILTDIRDFFNQK